MIDVGRQWLRPGLVDIHTHLDLWVELAPGLCELVRQGTTTVVAGNCRLGTVVGAQRANGDDPVLERIGRSNHLTGPRLLVY